MALDPKIERLRKLHEEAKLGGGPERIEQQHKWGQLTAQERLDLKCASARWLSKGTF